MIFIDHFGNVELDTVQDCSSFKWVLMKYKPILSPPNISQGDHDYQIRGNLRLLTITDVVEIECKDGTADIIDSNSGSKKLKDDTLPNESLVWTKEKELTRSFSDR